MTGRTVVCEPSDEIAKHTHLIAKLGRAVNSASSIRECLAS